MPNNKKKSLRDVKNAQGAGIVGAHPYSRKATQMRRALHRESVLTEKTAKRDDVKFHKAERIVYFRLAVPDDKQCATFDELHEYIQLYISRNDDEMKKLTENVRPGRPRPPKLDLLESLKKKDIAEYEKGFGVPNLVDPNTVKILRACEGDYNAIMSRVKLIRVTNPHSTSNAGLHR
ncbi:translation machinery-associated protein 16 [Cladochytrium replicatum]|nr:translation machinery-associated protein 16 [Cladochytrium replicatum]